MPVKSGFGKLPVIPPRESKYNPLFCRDSWYRPYTLKQPTVWSHESISIRTASITGSTS